MGKDGKDGVLIGCQLHHSLLKIRPNALPSLNHKLTNTFSAYVLPSNNFLMKPKFLYVMNVKQLINKSYLYICFVVVMMINRRYDRRFSLSGSFRNIFIIFETKHQILTILNWPNTLLNAVIFYQSWLK